jgi:hypothetical protein
MSERGVLENRVIRVARDVRSSAGGLRVATGTRPGSLAAAFAMALLARYQGRQERRWGVDFAFRRRPSSVTLQPVYQRLGLHLAPRLSLTVLAPPRPAEALNAPAAPARWVGRIERQVVREPILRPPGAAVRERLVTHLVTERERVEAGATPGRRRADRDDAGPLVPSRGRFAPMAPPVPRVVQRPAAVTTMDSQSPSAAFAATAEVQGGDGFGARRPGGSAAGPLEAGAVDVKRLTDQVIQAIDQRIIAQRERLGRV